MSLIEGPIRVGDKLKPRRTLTSRIWRVSARDTMSDGTTWFYLVPVGDETNGGGSGRGGRLSGGVRRLRRLRSELTNWERVP